jgi:hypothetical protein
VRRVKRIEQCLDAFDETKLHVWAANTDRHVQSLSFRRTPNSRNLENAIFKKDQRKRLVLAKIRYLVECKHLLYPQVATAFGCADDFV